MRRTVAARATHIAAKSVAAAALRDKAARLPADKGAVPIRRKGGLCMQSSRRRRRRRYVHLRIQCQQTSRPGGIDASALLCKSRIVVFFFFFFFFFVIAPKSMIRPACHIEREREREKEVENRFERHARSPEYGNLNW